MDIKRAGSKPSTKGPADWFTGTVRIDPLFDATAPARAAGARVTFEPGARTAWHTHPLGQTLIVTVGRGRVQREGGPDRGDPAGRRRLVRAGREALARRVAHDGHDAHRHPGGARRQGGRVDGAGDRRAVRRRTQQSLTRRELGTGRAGDMVVGLLSHPRRVTDDGHRAALSRRRDRDDSRHRQCSGQRLGIQGDIPADPAWH